MDLTSFGVAMGLGLAWFFAVLVLFRPGRDKLGLLLRIFVLGMLVCVPAGQFNTYWLEALFARLVSVDSGAAGLQMGTLQWALLWVLVAPVEEILKYCIVRACTARRPRFEDPRDVCLLAAVSALGFATFENYHYMRQHGFEVIYLRGWLCPPGHMLFSALWGYYLGLAWTRGYEERQALAEGLAIGSAAHGIYNFSGGLLSGIAAIFPPVLVVGGLAYVFRTRLWTNGHAPWVAARTDSRPSSARLPAASKPLPISADPRVGELVTRMDDLEARTRIDALRQAQPVQDQRVLEKVRSLTRDPEPSVREVARAVLARMERITKPG